MPKLIINDAEVEVPDGITLIQACELAGVEIPRFCYHERLSIAGNCRMCLVQVEGMPKPVASCAMGVSDLRPGRDGTPPTIYTDNEMVKKAREGVMEFLLVNHPLDCPICDQGGECDLQDQAMAYGFDGGRFADNKRAVENKYLGPLIGTYMNRCIHCTRCVRFMTEVAGVEELGAIGRGEDMEITTYLEQGMMSELSGNVVDLCPVGALTSKPYAFVSRPWELSKVDSVDVMDAVGSAIRVDSRDREVLRILPRPFDAVNEEWITDKTRHVWDGLRTQRLDRPYIRENGKLRPATWDEAFGVIAEKLDGLDGKRFAAIAGDLAALEETYALKQLSDALSSPNTDCRQDGAKLDPTLGRASYLFNSGIAGIDEADAILLVGTNPRLEAAILNARIRKRYRADPHSLTVGVIGEESDLHYPYEYLGAGPDTLSQIADGSHEFLKSIEGAKRPMVIVGQGALARKDGAGVLAMAAKAAQAMGALTKEWNGFNVLHTAASRTGALDLGFVPGKGGKDVDGILNAAEKGDMDVVYLLGADELEVDRLGKAFVIYQGSHGDRGAHRADVILPGAAYTEKDALYVNTEGRPQSGARAIFPPGEAREDWKIVRALSERLGKTLPYDSLAQLRSRMFADNPHLALIGTISPAETAVLANLAKTDGKVSKGGFKSPIADFYLTNPIARASAIMAQLSAMHAEAEEGATGTDG
ncbi:NADH-quinone oxidoreductase chain 3 [Methyloligella halotolerans]|uniref:NADH-quinone oxidoreductase n=1 Tax=Methyloligella halotolerans TaxID=1177755 RepID=A0A1E2S2F1_9HYPH|nr:NADH-quinone oxidoreductase subunit NuoG [Methyloligella halotolerans]ODA68515.1 NADH-quinone oxidoreductase chain 3 [Methyloligella halotolerans]